MSNQNRDRNSAAHKRGDAIKTRSSTQDLERKLREGQRAGNAETSPEQAARGGEKKDRQRS